ncbi:MAG: hypothetical protein Q9191_005308 [Dirinaria sp. TL-2023a]
MKSRIRCLVGHTTPLGPSVLFLSFPISQPSLHLARPTNPQPDLALHPFPPKTRLFSTSSIRPNWLAPKRGHSDSNNKGKPHVATGGSTRGTTVVWGDWGLRMRDHDRRISAKQLQIGFETIRRRLRGERFRLYTRVCANIGVYTTGNEMRMGKGKGSFDHWATRVGVNRMIFELKGDLHEEIVRDAFRLAGNKLPGE